MTSAKPWHSQTWTFVDGAWLEGNPPLTGPRSHAFWLGTSVFDGARYFEGRMPDIELHARRVNESARKMDLLPKVEVGRIVELTREGAKKFGPDAALYVRPMYWGEADSPNSVIAADPEATRFCLCLYEAPMPAANGTRLTVSRFRRPTLETMPTDEKSGCLYPNNARCIRDAKSRGFDNALVLDMLGNVAETATANIFMAKDSAVFTPAPNGCFLNGITRQRVIKLLRDDGVEVVEKVLSVRDFLEADEVFTSGNYGKVQPIVGVEEKVFQPGPFFRKARELYWAFAHDGMA